MKKILMASVVALTATSAAVASEGNMQGFYVGANAGYATATADLKGTAFGAAVGNPAFRAGFRGFTGGFQAGYNHQINDFVIGLELGFNFGNLESAARLNAANNVVAKRKNEFLAAARLGYMINNWMPYIKAGISNFKAEATGNVGANANGGGAAERFTVSGRSTAFLVGAGVETAIADNFLVGLEYTTAKLKDLSYTNAAGNTNLTVDGSRTHEVKVRLGYKF